MGNLLQSVLELAKTIVPLERNDLKASELVAKQEQQKICLQNLLPVVGTHDFFSQNFQILITLFPFESAFL